MNSQEYLAYQEYVNTGNASLTLLNGFSTDGSPIMATYNLWITGFNVSLYTQYDNSQLRRGMSWFPIRRGEQMVTFTIDWPMQTVYSSTTKDGYNYNGFKAMQTLQNAIIRHQQLCLARATNIIPMTFYFNNNTGPESNTLINYNLATTPKPSNEPSLEPITYQGWIDTADKEYERYKSVFTRSYRMNILVPRPANAGKTNFLNQGVGEYQNLKPTAISVEENGDKWISTTPSYNNSIQVDWIPS